MYPNVFSPGKIGGLSLRNRLVMPPMGTNYGSSDGFVTQRILDYYEARAAGGVGLIIVEFTCVDFPTGKGEVGEMSIDDDKYVPGLGQLAATIKRHGAKAVIQLHHAGREGRGGDPSIGLVAPSALRSLNPSLSVPKALSTGEVREVIGKFVVAAERAKAAGFDGVELHGAHSYLLGQFLSPLCNKRDDEYGGSLENRARIIVEIVAGIRARLGRDYPLLVRLSGDEFVEGGFTIDDTCYVAKTLEEAGVDCIDVSAAGSTSPKPMTIGPAYMPPGHLLPLAERVKREVHVPVIGVGRINRPEAAEAALRDGKCDLVAIGRALLADPEFPNKSAQGRRDLIRPCSACLHCFHTLMFEDKPITCSNNPALGRERELSVQPAAQKKKVFVVGGGVAGMEAARMAARRGHAVTIFERGEELGGQIKAAAIPPHKGELNLLRDYYLAEMRDTGVHTKLGEAIDAAAILAGGPDAVIVATGSRPQMPDIPGIGGPNVVLAEDVLLNRAQTGLRVVVIGGELVGCETAEHLAGQGKQVTIARRGKRLAAKMEQIVRRALLDRLAELRVATVTGVSYEEVTLEGVVVRAADGARQLLAADTVVVAAGSVPQQALAEELKGKVAMIELIGDAAQPRRFLEAIREGAAAGLAV